MTTTFLSAGIFSAARADMEFNSTLPEARHYVENLLTAFSHAVCSRNTSLLGELTQHVAVGLGTPATLPGPRDPGQIIDWFAHSAPTTTQIVTNLSLGFFEDAVTYTAIYQDWEPESGPRCSALGTYHGRLKAGPTVWRWEEHTVTRLSARIAQTDYKPGAITPRAAETFKLRHVVDMNRGMEASSPAL
jgi:hypothetical protein